MLGISDNSGLRGSQETETPATWGRVFFPQGRHASNVWQCTKLHEWRVYLQRWFLGFKGMRSVRTLRQKRRSSTKLGSKNCVTIFGAEFGSAAAEYGPIRKKLWRQPSSFKQYFQTKLCTKKMWQNRLRFGRDVNSERVLNWTEKPCPFYKQTWVCTNIYKIDRLVTV